MILKARGAKRELESASADPFRSMRHVVSDFEAGVLGRLRLLMALVHAGSRGFNHVAVLEDILFIFIRGWWYIRREIVHLLIENAHMLEDS